MSRAGEVSRKLLGPYFHGSLVTDCYAGYEAHPAKAKQKCLAHLARTARDWQKVVPSESAASTFFTDLKEWVRRDCRFYHQRRRGELSAEQLTAEEKWLREELSRLESCPWTMRKHCPCKSGFANMPGSGWSSWMTRVFHRPTIWPSVRCGRWWCFARSPSATAAKREPRGWRR